MSFPHVNLRKRPPESPEITASLVDPENEYVPTTPGAAVFLSFLLCNVQLIKCSSAHERQKERSEEGDGRTKGRREEACASRMCFPRLGHGRPFVPVAALGSVKCIGQEPSKFWQTPVIRQKNSSAIIFSSAGALSVCRHL